MKYAKSCIIVHTYAKLVNHNGSATLSNNLYDEDFEKKGKISKIQNSGHLHGYPEKGARRSAERHTYEGRLRRKRGRDETGRHLS
jgi:hypothetical protein